MYTTFSDIVTIFKPTPEDCWRFAVRDLSIYVISSENTYKALVHPNGQNTCGLFTGYTETYVWKFANCKSYFDTIKHEYAHYLDFTYLHTHHLNRPPWWSEGLATYISDVCYENVRYSGTGGLRALLANSSVSAYEKGSIMHGFLDSTPTLRRYHRKLWIKIYTNKAYANLEEEVVEKFVCLFKQMNYCKMYEKKFTDLPEDAVGTTSFSVDCSTPPLCSDTDYSYAIITLMDYFNKHARELLNTVLKRDSLKIDSLDRVSDGALFGFCHVYYSDFEVVTDDNSWYNATALCKNINSNVKQ